MVTFFVCGCIFIGILFKKKRSYSSAERGNIEESNSVVVLFIEKSIL
jgi:hypothetical protein